LLYPFQSRACLAVLSCVSAIIKLLKCYWSSCSYY